MPGASPPLPPDAGRLLSDMGMRRGRRTGAQRMHAGMDLGHPGGRGTPILNVQDGVVERVISDSDRGRAFSGYGNGVIVRHPDDTWALYAHMNNVAVAEGAPVVAGQTLGAMGNSSNGKFRGMGVHLHLELRRRTSSGNSPFPGPYPQSPDRLRNNLDPRPWLEGKGLVFLRRGGFELTPGSQMDQGRSRPGVAGVDPYPKSAFMAWRMPETSLAGDVVSDADHPYEPPANFDRDVYFGLTPVEWAAAGAGTLVLTGASVALLVRWKRKRPTANRPRRLKRRTSRRSRLRA